jgi:hypothetical protein
MTIASGTNVVVGFELESTYGTAATGNDYEIIPFKSASLSLAKTNHESAVITGNREVQDVIMGAHSVTGEISFDLAHQPAYTTMLQAVLGSAADGSSTAFGIGKLRQSFTIAQDFGADIGTGNDCHVYTGCEFNNFSMSIPADGLIECSVGIIGQTMVAQASAPDANGPDDDGSHYVETNDPFHSSNATITSADLNAILTDLSLSVENGIETTNKVGDVKPIRGGIGKCRVSGSVTAHFTSANLLQKFIDNTSSSLLISFGSGATGISFNMPKIIYTTGAVEVGGEGLVSVAMDFVAVANSASQSTLVIDTDLS